MKIFCSAKSEMMGMTTVFNASGVDKENFVKYTEENPATYRVPDLNIFTKSFCRDGLSHLFCLAWSPKHRTGLVLGTRRPLERKTTWRVPILTGECRVELNSNNNNNCATLTNIFNFFSQGVRGSKSPRGDSPWNFKHRRVVVSTHQGGLFDFFTLTLIFGILVFEIWYLLVMKLISNWYWVFAGFHLSGLCSPWLGLEDFLTFTFVNDKYQVN